MRIDSSGRVLIGTTTAAARLDVRSTSGLPSYLESSANPTNAVMMSISNQTITSNNGCKIALDAYNIGGVALGIPTGDAALAFYTSSATAERMRISSAGDVGIGTSSPTAYGANFRTLDIKGVTQGSLVLGHGSTNAFIAYGASTESGIATLTSTPLVFQTNSVERMRVDTNGNLLIKTTTASYSNANRGNITIGGTSTAICGFQINGAAVGYVYHSGNDFQMWNETNTPIRFGTNALERMRIDGSGNALVGTTATAGSTSNNAMVVGGILKTISGSVSSTSGSATTLFTAPTLANGTYIVSVGINNTGEPAFYSAVSLISVDSTVIVATALKTAGGMTISVSGQNVQATQSSGITATIVWTATRVH
jgi:hypothetical protein